MKSILLIGIPLLLVACAKPNNQFSKPYAGTVATAQDKAFATDIGQGRWSGKCYSKSALIGSFASGSQRYELQFLDNAVSINKVSYEQENCKGTVTSSSRTAKMLTQVAAKNANDATVSFFKIKSVQEDAKTQHDIVEVRSDLVGKYQAILSEDGTKVVFKNKKMADFFGMDAEYTREIMDDTKSVAKSL